MGASGKDVDRAAAASGFVRAAACALGGAAGRPIGHRAHDGLFLGAVAQPGYAAAVALAQRVGRCAFQLPVVGFCRKGRKQLAGHASTSTARDDIPPAPTASDRRTIDEAAGHLAWPGSIITDSAFDKSKLAPLESARFRHRSGSCAEQVRAASQLSVAKRTCAVERRPAGALPLPGLGSTARTTRRRKTSLSPGPATQCRNKPADVSPMAPAC